MRRTIAGPTATDRRTLFSSFEIRTIYTFWGANCRNQWKQVTAFSFVRRLSTRHCPHLRPSAVPRSSRCCWPPATAAAAAACGGRDVTDGQRDRQTDRRPTSHKPASAYYAMRAVRITLVVNRRQSIQCCFSLPPHERTTSGSPLKKA